MVVGSGHVAAVLTSNASPVPSSTMTAAGRLAKFPPAGGAAILAAMTMIGADGQIRLECVVCGSTDFERQESRQDSRWGFTTHRMTLMVCVNCRYVMHFHDAHSLFDFE